MTQRASLVGGSGFLGRALAAELVGRGWTVTIHDMLSPEVVGTSFATCDIAASASEFPAGTNAVIYLAQSPHYRDFPARAGNLFGVNTLGLVRAAEAAVRVGAKTLLYASTGNVYEPSFLAHAENDPLQRLEPYGLSKVMGEDVLGVFSGHLHAHAVRIFGLYGRGQRAMLPARIKESLEKKIPIQLHPRNDRSAIEGDEGIRISYCHVDNAAGILADLVNASMTNRVLPPVLNLAGPDPISLRRFAETMGHCLGILPQFVISETPREFDLIADISLLRQTLNPSFTPFEAAMTASYRP